MKRILLPTDFSGNSLKGIEYAIELYGIADAEYLLVHAVEPPPGKASVFVSLIDRMMKDAREKLSGLEKRIRSQESYNGIVLKTLTVQDSLVTNIEEIIEANDIHVIVMGTTGSDDKGLQLIGSNTFQVVRLVNIPVYVVPKGCNVRRPSEIGLASDLSDISKATVDRIIAFTKRYSAKLNIVKVSAPTEHIAEEVVDKYDHDFEGIEHEFHIIEGGDDFSQDMNDFAVENHIDLLLMIRQKHTFWEKLFNVSATKKMTLQSDIPLLIFKEE